MVVLFYYVVVSLLCYLGATADAHAYIDPGTGSILLQSIIGAIAVGASFVAGFWHKIRSFCRRIMPGRNPEERLTVEKTGDGASQK